MSSDQNITLGELAKRRLAGLEVANLIAPDFALNIEQTNINHYRTKNTGHGYAAEDANALNDILRGRKVDLTGKSRELNGADRIVDGVKVQTKYCQSAEESVAAAFKGGRYQYDGQVIEVPRDQYKDAVELMRRRIEEGQVPSVTDPCQAENMVKEGSVTYQQAKNIAKAGNIDSIVFDVKSQAISTSFAFTLSFAITFAMMKHQGVDTKVALKASFMAGLQVAGISMFSGVVTAQLLRTRMIGGVGKVVASNAVKAIYKTEMGKRFIIRYASALNGEAMGAVASRNYAAKALRTNVVTGAVVTLVMTAPDAYRALVHKNVSWAQVSKNLVVNASGVFGGLSGAAGGAVGGAAICTMFFPIVGTGVGATVGGIVGGLGLGFGASSLSKVLMDFIVVDDAQEMVEMLPELLQPLAFDFMLSEEEIEDFTKSVRAKISPAFLRDMYQSQDKGRFVYGEFESACEEIAAKRPKVTLPTSEEIFKAGSEFVHEIEQFELGEARIQLLVTLKAAAEIDDARLVSGAVESHQETQAPQPDPRKEKLIGILSSKASASLRSRFGFSS